ncbi:rh177 [macacine betaherpesvirus 3]|uniref:Rh177 n=1 Tax=Rhesus cytomegalovirus (strain 68-1) TaxID=47929 RepID=Q2FAC5_RHCM6|nr:rh177 [macacine betaherpesvirus 3]
MQMIIIQPLRKVPIELFAHARFHPEAHAITLFIRTLHTQLRTLPPHRPLSIPCSCIMLPPPPRAAASPALRVRLGTTTTTTARSVARVHAANSLRATAPTIMIPLPALPARLLRCYKVCVLAPHIHPTLLYEQTRQYGHRVMDNGLY